METGKTPATPEEITAFLLCCLYVLQTISYGKRCQSELGDLLESGRGDMGEAQYMERQKLLLPCSIRYDLQIRALLDTEEGRYTAEHLPLPYCDTDTVLWLLHRHLRRNFPDLPSAFQACRRSLSLRWNRLCRSPRERRIHRAVLYVMENRKEALQLSEE